MNDDFTTLHFAYATDAPSLDAFDVKSVTPAELLGEPAALTVIGESHYVGLPALDFHEVCSCKPLSAESAYTVPLELGVEKTLAFETDSLSVETAVEVQRIDQFPGAESATASYRFGPDAWTTVEVGNTGAVGESPPSGDSPLNARYETYHTYPEYELAVYTETRLTPESENPTENGEPLPSTNDD